MIAIKPFVMIRSYGTKRALLRYSFVAILMVATGSFMFSLGLLSVQNISYDEFVPNQREEAAKPLPQVKLDLGHDNRAQQKEYTQPTFQEGILGNYEPKEVSRKTGLGEYGVAVELVTAEEEDYKKAYKNYGFNMVISDRISLDRSVPDIRDGNCRYWHYPENLPKASVAVVFHNEGWSTLMRTIHSIFNTSPPHLLQQVVMVDDFSTKEHLRTKLEDYIRKPRFENKIKLVRTKEREGLIRARIIGAKNSDAEVVVFLDAHCECGTNWLPPLLSAIAVNRTTVVCPTVDAVEASNFRYGPQGSLCRGAFDWEFWYKRIPIEYSKENTRRKYKTEPYFSPVMAGGLFAIDRSYFFEIGTYDDGLEIWGGENYELSFKIWMCGGTLLFVPCSRVGHVYRHGVPYKYKDLGTGVSVVHHNYMRVAEVWMDEYKKYFYSARPDLEGKSHGDISAQVKFRQDHCPRSFKWFMEEVAYELIDHYPLPFPNVAFGEIRAVISSKCMDTWGQHDSGGPMSIGRCHGMGGNQFFRINEAGMLIFNDVCLYYDSFKHIRTKKCIQSSPAKLGIWKYESENQRIFVPKDDLCLDHNSEEGTIFVSQCQSNSKTQDFKFLLPIKT